MIPVLGLRKMGKLKMVGMKDKDLGAVHKIRVIVHVMAPYVSKQGNKERGNPSSEPAAMSTCRS